MSRKTLFEGIDSRDESRQVASLRTAADLDSLTLLTAARFLDYLWSSDSKMAAIGVHILLSTGIDIDRLETTRRVKKQLPEECLTLSDCDLTIPILAHARVKRAGQGQACGFDENAALTETNDSPSREDRQSTPIGDLHLVLPEWWLEVIGDLSMPFAGIEKEIRKQARGFAEGRCRISPTARRISRTSRHVLLRGCLSKLQRSLLAGKVPGTIDPVSYYAHLPHDGLTGLWAQGLGKLNDDMLIYVEGELASYLQLQIPMQTRTGIVIQRNGKANYLAVNTLQSLSACANEAWDIARGCQSTRIRKAAYLKGLGLACAHSFVLSSISLALRALGKKSSFTMLDDSLLAIEDKGSKEYYEHRIGQFSDTVLEARKALEYVLLQGIGRGLLVCGTASLPVFPALDTKKAAVTEMNRGYFTERSLEAGLQDSEILASNFSRHFIVVEFLEHISEYENAEILGHTLGSFSGASPFNFLNPKERTKLRDAIDEWLLRKRVDKLDIPVLEFDHV